VLKPFLLDLLDQGIAQSTFRRHRDNTCALGGVLIHDRYDDSELAALPAEQALRRLVENDEAPLMWAGVTESEQRTYDTTARKLNKFLQRNLDPEPPKSATAQRRHGGDRATPQTREPGRRRGGACPPAERPKSPTDCPEDPKSQDRPATPCATGHQHRTEDRGRNRVIALTMASESAHLPVESTHADHPHSGGKKHCRTERDRIRGRV
jgi:hypothetical protein